jgi:uncharacterized membrane-anchored protein YhcB (DUF1043 family)
MRIILGLLFAVIVSVVLVAQTPELTEVQKLRAEVHQLKTQLLETRYQLATCQAQQQASMLAKEQVALEEEFRALLKPSKSEVFDWSTLSFKPAPPK